MRDFIGKIKGVNQILYNTLNKGRDFWGEEWNDTSFYTVGGALAYFHTSTKEAKRYLAFAEYDFYWSKLMQDLQYKEVESPGYAGRMQKYFECYARYIRKADFTTLRQSIFVANLLEDGYISQEEADDYCKLLASVHDKAYKDAIRAYKIILDITNPKGETGKHTPALDFMFHSKDELRDKFIRFFKSNHGNIKLTATDAVQILFLALGGRDRFDLLGKNGLNAKYLWSDFRLVGIIGSVVKDVSDRALNIAAKNNAAPKSDVNTAWDSFK